MPNEKEQGHPEAKAGEWEGEFDVQFVDEDGSDWTQGKTADFKSFIRQLLSRSRAQGYEEGVRASLEALPEKDESDGWEEFFDRKNVGVCCPGDDLANGWNAARAAISALLTQGK